MEWKSWKYKNLTILACTFVLSFTLGALPPFKHFVLEIGLPLALVAGVLFVSTFTAPISAITLLLLAEKYPLYEIWIVASIGALIIDFFFFNKIKDNLAKEVGPIYEKLSGNHFHKVLKTKHFRWLFPVVGAAIILSPLPKAPGIHLLGIPNLKKGQFLALSFFVNIIGIAFILCLSFFIKP